MILQYICLLHCVSNNRGVHACCYRMQVRFLFSPVCDLFILFFLFLYEIFRKRLNGFAPNSHGRRIWSLARTSLNVRVKGQSHHGVFLPIDNALWGVAYAVRCKWRHPAADGTIPSLLGVTAVHADGGLRAVCVWWNIFSSSSFIGWICLVVETFNCWNSVNCASTAFKDTWRKLFLLIYSACFVYTYNICYMHQ